IVRQISVGAITVQVLVGDLRPWFEFASKHAAVDAISAETGGQYQIPYSSTAGALRVRMDDESVGMRG
ncbi:MAG: hypothetical protein ACJ8EL_20020, partial [Rhizomicrobium sp.]